MMLAEKHIRSYNALHGKKIGKSELSKFHAELKRDIDAKRIDSHMPFGIECIDIEKRISAALKKMNGHKVTINCKLVNVEKILVAQKQVVAKKDPKMAAPVKKVTLPKVTTDHRQDNSKVTKKEKPRAISPELKGLGFVTADHAPEKLHDTFQLPGEIGKFLGEQQQYRCQIIIEGDKHSSKSELAKQVADSAIDYGFSVALVDWEQGGLISKDTVKGIERNVKPENRKNLYVSSDIPTTQQGLEKLTQFFEMIIVDSGTKVNSISNTWLDDLRVNHPETIWVMLMQRNAKGTTRGGTSAGYNAPVIIFTHRPDRSNYLKNFASLEKNRGNQTDRKYLIAQKRVLIENQSGQ